MSSYVASSVLYGSGEGVSDADKTYRGGCGHRCHRRTARGGRRGAGRRCGTGKRPRSRRSPGAIAKISSCNRWVRRSARWSPCRSTTANRTGRDSAGRVADLHKVPDAGGAGRHAGEPGWPGRLRPRAARSSASLCPTARATLRLDRVRPARRGLEQPRCPAIPNYFGQPAELHPVESIELHDLAEPVAGLRRGVRGKRGALLRPHDDGRLGATTWTASARPSASSRSTTTASPTARTSARCTGRCSRRACAAWCSTATSTRAGLVPREPRPGHRVRPQHQDLVRLARQVRQRLPPRRDREGGRAAVLRARAQADGHPADGKIGPTSGSTSSSTPGYYR